MRDDGADVAAVERSLRPDAVVLGLPGVDLHAGDHLCAFYRGAAERDEILLSYLRGGIDADDKVVCVVETIGPAELVDALGPAANAAIASGALEVLTPEETYLRTGQFEMPAMLAYWQESVGRALTRFGFVRIVGEMPRALTDKPDLDEFWFYESELNRFVIQHPQVVVCLYDLDRFGGSLLIDILRTHPLVMLGGALMENPYFLNPDEFLAARRRVPS